MELTKHGHACITLTKDGVRLVIDPGSYTSPDALDGATAVLITHEHADHFQPGLLNDALHDDPDLTVIVPPSCLDAVGSHGGRVLVVGHGDGFEVGGFSITALGEWHEVIHPDIPRVRNVGFLVDGTLFHPGDAYTVPPVAVDTLLTPLYSPWTGVTGLVDWVRAVRPRQTIAVHDAPLNDIGHEMINRFLRPGALGTGAEHHQLAVGDRVQIP